MVPGLSSMVPRVVSGDHRNDHQGDIARELVLAVGRIAGPLTELREAMRNGCLATVDDNFDDNPGERRQTPANSRFE